MSSSSHLKLFLKINTKILNKVHAQLEFSTNSLETFVKDLPFNLQTFSLQISKDLSSSSQTTQKRFQYFIIVYSCLTEPLLMAACIRMIIWDKLVQSFHERHKNNYRKFVHLFKVNHRNMRMMEGFFCKLWTNFSYICYIVISHKKIACSKLEVRIHLYKLNLLKVNNKYTWTALADLIQLSCLLTLDAYRSFI